jgi:hypothetical protein
MRCRRGPDGEFIAEVPSMSELETKLNNILEEHQHESGLHMIGGRKRLVDRLVQFVEEETHSQPTQVLAREN